MAAHTTRDVAPDDTWLTFVSDGAETLMTANGSLRCEAWRSPAGTFVTDPVGASCPKEVELARPTGVGRAISTYTIPIEGRDEWLAAARRLA